MNRNKNRYPRAWLIDGFFEGYYYADYREIGSVLGDFSFVGGGEVEKELQFCERIVEYLFKKLFKKHTTIA